MKWDDKRDVREEEGEEEEEEGKCQADERLF